MEIYLLTGSDQTGPYSTEDVRAMVTSGKVARNDLAWREGLTEWQPVKQVVDLPAKPLPPPLPQGSLSLFAGLPPPPARSQRPLPTFDTAVVNTRPASTIRTVSGVLALILGLLSIFNIGGCMNARAKLTKFQSGDNAMDSMDILVDTARGMNEGDPLRGVSGMLGKARSLQDDYEGFQVGAWLTLAGTTVAVAFPCFAAHPRGGRGRQECPFFNTRVMLHAP